MARAETIENVGETGGGGGRGGGGGGGGGGGPLLPHQNSCCMEMPRPLHTWPRLLATTTITTNAGVGGAMHPLQALYLNYPLPYLHPEGRDETRSHLHQQQLPSTTPPPSPLCNQRRRRRRRRRRGDGMEDRASNSDSSDLDVEDNMAASRGPLPDLLPQMEPDASRASAQQQALQDMEVRRVANQLRAIGDEFNTTIVLRRAHIAPLWRNWRDVCRELLNFIAQTLSPLYRLT